MAEDEITGLEAQFPMAMPVLVVDERNPEMRGVVGWKVIGHRYEPQPEVLVGIAGQPHRDRWVRPLALIANPPTRPAQDTKDEAVRYSRAVGDLIGEDRPAGYNIEDLAGTVRIGYVDDNPKTAAGARKPSLGAIPGPALLALGLAMESGRIKYGLTNWREFHVTTSTYTNAARRHILEFNDGQTFDVESGIHQLGMVMACCAIVIDAMAQGTITDDRTKFPGKTSELIKLISEGLPNAICEPR